MGGGASNCVNGGVNVMSVQRMLLCSHLCQMLLRSLSTFKLSSLVDFLTTVICMALLSRCSCLI